MLAAPHLPPLTGWGCRGRKLAQEHGYTLQADKELRGAPAPWGVGVELTNQDEQPAQQRAVRADLGRCRRAACSTDPAVPVPRPASRSLRCRHCLRAPSLQPSGCATSLPPPSPLSPPLAPSRAPLWSTRQTERHVSGLAGGEREGHQRGVGCRCKGGQPVQQSRPSAAGVAGRPPPPPAACAPNACRLRTCAPSACAPPLPPAALSSFVTGVAVLIITLWFTGIFTNMPDNLTGEGAQSQMHAPAVHLRSPQADPRARGQTGRRTCGQGLATQPGRDWCVCCWAPLNEPRRAACFFAGAIMISAVYRVLNPMELYYCWKVGRHPPVVKLCTVFAPLVQEARPSHQAAVDGIMASPLGFWPPPAPSCQPQPPCFFYSLQVSVFDFLYYLVTLCVVIFLGVYK